jgi:hypothetical protein
MLKDLKRTDPEAPIVSYRCELHDPMFGLIICERRYGGSCEHLRPKSREGCVALKWSPTCATADAWLIVMNAPTLKKTASKRVGGSDVPRSKSSNELADDGAN